MMGTVTLLAACAVEIIRAAYCLATKSHQEKTRSAVRIAAFAVFIFLSFISVIQWSFRWYGLGALLLVWPVSGTVVLFRRNTREKDFHARQVVSSAISTLLLVYLAALPALVFPQHKIPETTGLYTVASVQYTFIDGDRIEKYARRGEKRKVNVEFWYPAKADGVFPLVLFSHGALGIQTSNLSLYHELASHGYVVASVGHPYQFSLTDLALSSPLLARMLEGEKPNRNREECLKSSTVWYSNFMMRI